MKFTPSKRITALLIGLISSILLVTAANPSASSQLEKCADAFKKAASLKIDFTLGSGEQQVNMIMVVSGSKFTLDGGGMKLWYDGKTQWTYLTDYRELNINEPTSEELLEINPFTIVNNWQKHYTARRLEDKKPVIELVPRKGTATNIRKAVVTFDTKTDLPSKLVITLSDGRTMTAVVTNISTGTAMKATDFVYDKVKYPASEVIDLR